MSTALFNFRKALSVYGLAPDQLSTRGLNESDLPSFARGADNRVLKSWSSKEMPALGEKIGFMSQPASPVALAVFMTKGGVLKSTLTLNIARAAALHNIKTCVVGLDMQGDVTTALGLEALPDEDSTLEDAIDRMNSLRGLADVFTGESTLNDVIRPTDLPTLFYVPETPELVALDQSLVNKNRREYWLRDHVVAPLKKRFDLVIMDCSPNWNRLITNALVACDALVSPLECKINNFRNFKTFHALLSEFKDDMKADFTQIYIPTRLATGRKLSQEIFAWYRANLPECSSNAVRESVQGEESVAMRQSVLEYAPTSVAAEEMRSLVHDLWAQLAEASQANVTRATSQRAADHTV